MACYAADVCVDSPRMMRRGVHYLNMQPYPSVLLCMRPQPLTGTYFGGTVKRPQFPNAKGRIQLTRKAEAEAPAAARPAPEPAKTAAWDAWTSPAQEDDGGWWSPYLCVCVWCDVVCAWTHHACATMDTPHYGATWYWTHVLLVVYIYKHRYIWYIGVYST